MSTVVFRPAVVRSKAEVLGALAFLLGEVKSQACFLLYLMMF